MSIKIYGNSYTVIHKRKTICSYSINNYGDYAKKLAELSDKTKIRYKNYYEIIDNEYVIIHMYSKSFGYLDSYVDIDDFEKIKNYRWYPRKNKRNNTDFYAMSNSSNNNKHKNILLHRYVMGLGNKKDNKKYILVDHLNHNTLDNRKSNLRKVNTSLNAKNMRKKKGKNPWIGVIEMINKKGKEHGHGFMVRYRDKKSKVHSKHININKYGKELALEIAIYYSIYMRYKNDYILQPEDFEFLKNHNKSLPKIIKIKRVK